MVEDYQEGNGNNAGKDWTVVKENDQPLGMVS